MRPSAFRIRCFKSIMDSGWCNFSPDGVTVLVGQNESGKTSVLEALYYAARYAELDPASLRIGDDFPKIAIKAELDAEELEEILEDFSESFSALARTALLQNGLKIVLETSFSQKTKLSAFFYITEPIFIPLLDDQARLLLSDDGLIARNLLEKEMTTFTERIVDYYPYFSLYAEDASRLPDYIGIDMEGIVKGQVGESGANNFIQVAGLSLQELLLANDRLRGTLMVRANNKVNSELDKYWSQYLGASKKIKIEAEFSRRGTEAPSHPGEAYLSFWISEGEERFYPSQRSRGTRWFVSVFLHLLASEMSEREVVILLDEPGSYLHAKAQDDIRRLIERISSRRQVVYSTHSPDLVDFSKIYRVLAAERSSDLVSADTKLMQAMKIICASEETLSPILSRMGADMRHQSVLKSSKNVLLEEPSAHFYLKAMELLLCEDKNGFSYVPASGVNNVPTMFALMLAWGLGFVVLMDDDKQAKGVLSELSKNYFGQNDNEASKKIIMISGKDGIEDLFEKNDFFKFVLGNESIPNSDIANSRYMKEQKISKPVAAYKFFIKIESGEIKREHLNPQTISAFSEVFTRIKMAS